MFRYTKKIVTAASVLAFCSGQLYAMEVDEKDKKAVVVATPGIPDPRFQDGIPKNILRSIFKKASKDTKPCFASVCKDWHGIMRENNAIQENLNYSTLNPFMKECMKIWWAERFYKGVLLCKDPDGKELQLRVSDLKDGIFDLSACGAAAYNLVITTSVDRFFKVKEENENRVVILITPRHVVEEKINFSAQPFSPIMAGWDAGKSPIGIFWRWGNECDHLTARSLVEISSENLFENWKKGRTPTFGVRGMVDWRGWVRKGVELFHVRL